MKQISLIDFNYLVNGCMHQTLEYLMLVFNQAHSQKSKFFAITTLVNILQ
jgi:hypothetical protein